VAIGEELRISITDKVNDYIISPKLRLAVFAVPPRREA
jgi:hypothetical protein